MRRYTNLRLPLTLHYKTTKPGFTFGFVAAYKLFLFFSLISTKWLAAKTSRNSQLRDS